MTAPYGSSLVESSLTASRASSRAFVRARRDDGRGSDDFGSGGDSSNLSGIISCVGPGDLGTVRSIDRGGESDRLSEEEEDAVAGEEFACLACENAATAARFAEAAGRMYG